MQPSLSETFSHSLLLRSIAFGKKRLYHNDVYTSNMPSSIPCACTTVKKLSRILGRAYDEALEGSGINIAQLAVVRCIIRRAGEPLSRVAEELEMDRPSLYRAVAPMIRDGWIEVTAGSGGRSRAGEGTGRGKRVLAQKGGVRAKNKEWMLGAS